MRKLLFTLLVCAFALSMQAITHSYAPQSVLSQGNWVKIRVSESGIYQLTYDDLRRAGLSKPEQVRIYGYGGAMLTQDFQQPHIDDLPPVAFYMSTGSDGQFGPGDYILFYAQGSVSWTYSNGFFQRTRNPYSDYGYYFLSDDAGEQVLLQPGQDVSSSGQIVNTYLAYQLHEKEQVNLLDRINGQAGGGRDFYGESFNSNHSQQSFTLHLPDMVEGKPLYATIKMAATSHTRTYFDITIGNTSRTFSIDTIAPNDFYTMAKLGGLSNATFDVTPQTNQTVSIKYRNGTSGSEGNLDYIILSAECQLRLRDDVLCFRQPANLTRTTTSEMVLDNADATTQIWDITDLQNIRAVPTKLQGNQLHMLDTYHDCVHQYVAVRTAGQSFRSIGSGDLQIVGSIPAQNLHALNDIDFVIISPAEFAGDAQRLADVHEQLDGITTAVVTDQQVYNEFSSGTPDATAYRWLMKMLYDRGTQDGHRPQWLMLVGDGTFDNRKLLATSGPNTLLTYQSPNSTVETEAYATDDYFAFMDNNEGLLDREATLDLGVGRLPVSTAAQAKAVIDKLIGYMTNSSYGKWKNQMLFLADDGDNGLHTATAEEGAEKVRQKNPDFVVNKLYLDAYPQETNASGESYPLAKTRLDNLLRSGVLYFNYSGHGGYNSITNESMLNLNDIKKMNNANLAFWMFATCSFAHFDSGKPCAAEEAVLNPYGGAVGVLSACRTVYAHRNKTLNGHFCNKLFEHADAYNYHMTLGDATRQAKNMTGTQDNNKLAYVLLGDPAMHMLYPTELQVATITKMDTLHALQVQTVEGQMMSSDTEQTNWFNGKVDVTVYDKLQQIVTRDNDAPEDKKQTLIYKDYPNVLFSGTSDVVDGKFHFTFMTPKDIRYNYGKGRIVYYAYDTDNRAEGVGHFEDFYVGGTGNIVFTDTLGPDIRLYLNTPAFPAGGTCYDTPRLYAEIYDEHGINTVGSGIGHDLMLVIDNDPSLTFVLNSYFTASNDSYQQGLISYLLPKLSDGPHTLTLKAWDLLNNSNTATLDFVVEQGADPTIYSVDTYPNPVQETGIMTVQINYDQPDAIIECDFYLFDIAGHMVYSHHMGNPSDLQLNMGQMGLSPGVYAYTVRMRSETSRYTRAGGKIIVTK